MRVNLSSGPAGGGGGRNLPTIYAHKDPYSQSPRTYISLKEITVHPGY
jgi:hypothetical protein